MHLPTHQIKLNYFFLFANMVEDETQKYGDDGKDTGYNKGGEVGTREVNDEPRG